MLPAKNCTWIKKKKYPSSRYTKHFYRWSFKKRKQLMFFKSSTLPSRSWRRPRHTDPAWVKRNLSKDEIIKDSTKKDTYFFFFFLDNCTYYLPRNVRNFPGPNEALSARMMVQVYFFRSWWQRWKEIGNMYLSKYTASSHLCLMLCRHHWKETV